jgi:hypothetical protein
MAELIGSTTAQRPRRRSGPRDACISRGFHQLVQQRMDELGLRSRDLAADLDLTPGAVAHLIGLQRRLPPPEQLGQLSQILAVSLADLIEAAGYV